VCVNDQITFPSNLGMEDISDFQTHGNEKIDIDLGASLEEKSGEAGELEGDGNEDMGVDSNDSSNALDDGVDLDISSQANFKAGANSHKDLEDDIDTGVNIDVSRDRTAGFEHNIELDRERGEEVEYDASVYISLSLDCNIVANSIDLNLSSRTHAEEVPGACLELSNLTFLIEASNRGNGLTNGEIGGGAVGNSSTGVGSGSSDGKEAEGQNSSEDGTETHCC